MKSGEWSSHGGIRALIRRGEDRRTCLSLCTLSLPLPVHILRKQYVSTSHREAHLQVKKQVLAKELNLSAPWSWTSQLPEL